MINPKKTNKMDFGKAKETAVKVLSWIIAGIVVLLIELLLSINWDAVIDSAAGAEVMSVEQIAKAAKPYSNLDPAPSYFQIEIDSVEDEIKDHDVFYLEYANQAQNINSMIQVFCSPEDCYDISRAQTPWDGEDYTPVQTKWEYVAYKAAPGIYFLAKMPK